MGGCSAQQLKEDLPDCWPAISGALREYEVTRSAIQSLGCKIPSLKISSDAMLDATVEVGVSEEVNLPAMVDVTKTHAQSQGGRVMDDPITSIGIQGFFGGIMGASVVL